MPLTVEDGIPRLSGKNTGGRYLAYFQSFTGTYGPTDRMSTMFSQALSHPLTVGISIATRPDCLGPQVLALLSRLKDQYPDKTIWVELGLQTIYDKSAEYIRRGYPLSCFELAVHELNQLSIPVIVHMILGLPGEDSAMILEGIRYLNRHSIFGIKLQLLHILHNTDLFLDYQQAPWHVYTLEEYTDIVQLCLESLSPDITIHRLTGDGPRDLLGAPLWSSDKRKVLNTLHNKMKQTNSYQGKALSYDPGSINTL